MTKKLMNSLRRRQLHPLSLVSSEHKVINNSTSTTQSLSIFSLLGHELRTPLNAIVGFAELLQHAERDNTPQQQRLNYANTIVESAQHLQNLISQILDAGRAAAGELSCTMQEFDLAEILETTALKIKSLAEHQRVTLNLHVTDKITINGDIQRISQACSELFENAIRFSEPNGEVTVRIIRSKSNELILSIIDEGRGISKEVAKYLFDPFTQGSQGFTRSHGGLGLGLYLASAIAKLHGGRVELSSDSVTGTEARFILPADRVLWPTQSVKHYATA